MVAASWLVSIMSAVAQVSLNVHNPVYGPTMQVLVFGGTSFVGRAIVEDLFARGHTPTLFNRGRTGLDLFPGVARLVGDRDSGDYSALAGHRWDAVVDVTAYLPRHVEQAVAVLGGHDGRYVFISTGMVYDHDAADGEITEASPRLAPHLDDEVLDDETYGPHKVACEDSLLPTSATASASYAQGSWSARTIPTTV